jgi:hypothetical protein
MENNFWKKFYECDCTCEGIMMSYEIDDPDPVIDLAFYTIGFDSSKILTFKDKLRWCWHILIKGTPWSDMVILNQKQAKELGKDLLEFAEKKRR